MEKPRLSFWQVWNMSFGFLGIQFGFALQNANVSRIFETLGAKIDDIPILWIAAPTTGLLVQPIIGYMSDRTWSRIGRRRPYFLIGAILSTIALVFMPNSAALWIAAITLWILDASINISMEPFRALVADVLPSSQRTTGFALQSFFIGVGAVIASALPYLLTELGVANTAPAGQIPDSVKWSFYLGAAAFLTAVSWTVATTKEYPPDYLKQFYPAEETKMSMSNAFSEISSDLLKMPKTMKQLAIVQFFSWFALFAMWIYTANAVAKHIYNATDATSAVYQEAGNWVGVCFAAYNGFAAVFAFLIPMVADKYSRKKAHAFCLFVGAAGLISIYFVTSPMMLLVSMIGIGLAWASILSMPYAILAGALPPSKMGIYMGIFNFFIVIPQIAAAGILGFLVKNIFGGETIYAIVLGGVCMIIAALLVNFVDDKDDKIIK